MVVEERPQPEHRRHPGRQEPVPHEVHAVDPAAHPTGGTEGGIRVGLRRAGIRLHWHQRPRPVEQPKRVLHRSAECLEEDLVDPTLEHERHAPKHRRQQECDRERIEAVDPVGEPRVVAVPMELDPPFATIEVHGRRDGKRVAGCGRLQLADDDRHADWTGGDGAGGVLVPVRRRPGPSVGPVPTFSP